MREGWAANVGAFTSPLHSAQTYPRFGALPRTRPTQESKPTRSFLPNLFPPQLTADYYAFQEEHHRRRLRRRTRHRRHRRRRCRGDRAAPPPTETVGSGAVDSAAPSDQAGALYGSFVPSEEEGADPTFQIAAAVAGLVAFGAAGKTVADTIAVPGKVYASVKDFQQFVDDFTEDSRNFINSITPQSLPVASPTVPLHPGTRPLSARCRFLYPSPYIPHTPPRILYIPRTALLDSSYTSQCHSLT